MTACQWEMIWQLANESWWRLAYGRLVRQLAHDSRYDSWCSISSSKSVFPCIFNVSIIKPGAAPEASSQGLLTYMWNAWISKFLWWTVVLKWKINCSLYIWWNVSSDFTISEVRSELCCWALRAPSASHIRSGAPPLTTPRTHTKL